MAAALLLILVGVALVIRTARGQLIPRLRDAFNGNTSGGGGGSGYPYATGINPVPNAPRFQNPRAGGRPGQRPT